LIESAEKSEKDLEISPNKINKIYQFFTEQNLVDNTSPNAFESYFMGYFLSPINRKFIELGTLDYFKNFLEASSQKNYLRATNLFLEYLD